MQRAFALAELLRAKDSCWGSMFRAPVAQIIICFEFSHKSAYLRIGQRALE